MRQCHLGIDVSKESFHAALLTAEQTYRGQFSNDEAGFAKLQRWLQKRVEGRLHACMEATGRYWMALARFLHQAGVAVSVVNPKLIKKHGEATMQRNKTDRQDALTIADYCLKQQPDLWTPPPEAYFTLRELVRHRRVLMKDRTRYKNRRQSGTQDPFVLQLIDEQLAFIEDRLALLEARIQEHIQQHPQLQADQELLLSIPGIGKTTAAVFLAEIPDVELFARADQVAAFVGLTPGKKRSGSSLNKPGHLVKWGNSHIRAAFYMPALSAHVSNPLLANLRERLLARGKQKMTVVIAVMRKMVHLCYGVLKTRKPFDPNHLQTT
jgi:transposase